MRGYHFADYIFKMHFLERKHLDLDSLKAVHGGPIAATIPLTDAEFCISECINASLLLLVDTMVAREIIAHTNDDK